MLPVIDVTDCIFIILGIGYLVFLQVHPDNGAQGHSDKSTSSKGIQDIV